MNNLQVRATLQTKQICAYSGNQKSIQQIGFIRINPSLSQSKYTVSLSQSEEAKYVGTILSAAYHYNKSSRCFCLHQWST